MMRELSEALQNHLGSILYEAGAQGHLDVWDIAVENLSSALEHRGYLPTDAPQPDSPFWSEDSPAEEIGPTGYVVRVTLKGVVAPGLVAEEVVRAPTLDRRPRIGTPRLAWLESRLADQEQALKEKQEALQQIVISVGLTDRRNLPAEKLAVVGVQSLVEEKVGLKAAVTNLQAEVEQLKQELDPEKSLQDRLRLKIRERFSAQREAMLDFLTFLQQENLVDTRTRAVFATAVDRFLESGNVGG